MYLKIIREPVAILKNDEEVPVETMIECRKYDMFYRGDDLLHFWVEYFDGKRATYEASKEKLDEVYVMNANGKTLEHYVWG
jgi:hypothetical protein